MKLQFTPEQLFLYGAPFGADADNDPPDQGSQQQQNPPAGQGDPPGAGGGGGSGNAGGQKPPDKKDDSDDDEDPYKGLTPTELKKALSDAEKGKKDAEKDRDTYKGKVDEAERATKSKEDNLQADLDKEKETNKSLRATNARLAIVMGILMETKYRWHNPEIVAQQLDPKAVKVSDDGKVEGLTKELARIAKDHAYLLVTNQQGGHQGPTGFQPGQGGANQGGGKKPTAAELVKTYPAMASRA